MKGELADQKWRERAICVGLPNDLFFKPSLEEEAISVCMSCPVRQECLDMAQSIPTRDYYGVFGGMTPAERRAAKRSRIK